MIMLNVTLRRFDQSVKRLIVGHTTVICCRILLVLRNRGSADFDCL